jgi:hypothetical protein
VLRLLTPIADTNGIQGRWQSVSAQNYFLERSTDLGAVFAPVASGLIDQPGVTTHTDTNTTGTGPFFYRVGSTRNGRHAGWGSLEEHSHGFCSATNVEFLINMVQVGPHRVVADAHTVCNLLVAQSSSERKQTTLLFLLNQSADVPILCDYVMRRRKRYCL